MNADVNTRTVEKPHLGPHPGAVATIFTVLFLAGLYPVSRLNGLPSFPWPWESGHTLSAYFMARPTAVLGCAFLEFSAAILLGVFVAIAVARLHYLGIRSAGPTIGLFGGFLAAFDMAASACLLWALTRPGIAANVAVTQGLYYLLFAVAGVGVSVPLGLFMAGVSLPAGRLGLLPQWQVVYGTIVAMIGGVSWLTLIIPGAMFLIPLTEIPALVWINGTGYCFPKTAAAASARGTLGMAA